MTKAAFLDILHHVSSISDQEVNELEKLALTFPYCQSAHLLLAKAAYDQGSMLSNQRLRRAAACATNRQLLKKLIYTAGTDIILEPIPVTTEAVELITEPASETEVVPEPVIITESETITPEEAPLIDEITDSGTIELLADPLTEEVTAATEESTFAAETVTEAELRAFISEEPELLSELDALFSVENLVPSVAFRDPVTQFIIADEAESVPLPETSFENLDSAETMVSETEEEAIHPVIPETSEDQEKYTFVELNQPLADVDSAETLARFDEYLFTPEKEADAVIANNISQAYQEEILYKVFDANELGYWMDSSRLGETLLVKNELATAQPVYFRPELFLEYSKNHELASYQPPTPKALTRQLDIIDQFLKSNPKLKSMAHVKIKAESQEDLSSKSTKIKKNLASENLASILVQQGKTKKAIKIYEHLMLKIPEKKAYFASQIEKLQNLT